MAFNRIIWGLDWPASPQGTVDYPGDRSPSHERFISNGTVDYAALLTLPTLFMSEGQNRDDFARVGSVQVAAVGTSSITLRYNYDPAVPPIAQDRLREIAGELGLSTSGRQFDWTRTQWTVQEGDLYRAIIRLMRVAHNTPSVFTVSSPPRVDPMQISAMMPFDGGFTAVYASIEAAAAELALKCNRADNIWEHHTIIQDVVSLIDRSQVVICDLSGRNPNVFYEAGIAHSLGRQVILIVQHPDDVPFDLRHIRYITYHNNQQGHEELKTKLVARLRTLI